MSKLLCLNGPVQNRQCVCFVVIRRGMATLSCGRHHLLLVRVALAGRVLLDRANRNPLLRDLVVLAPCRQMGHEAAVSVSRIDAGMAADLFEKDRIDPVDRLLDLNEPALETQVAHAAPFESLGLERLTPTGDVAIAPMQRPTGLGAKIKGQD